jgi:hypothetical protein
MKLQNASSCKNPNLRPHLHWPTSSKPTTRYTSYFLYRRFLDRFPNDQSARIATMGCGSSHTKHLISHVDDSVKVMLKHDERRARSKGEAVAYKPRAEHPLLKPKASQGEEAGPVGAATQTAALESSSQPS